MKNSLKEPATSYIYKQQQVNYMCFIISLKFVCLCQDGGFEKSLSLFKIKFLNKFNFTEIIHESRQNLN